MEAFHLSFLWLLAVSPSLGYSDYNFQGKTRERLATLETKVEIMTNELIRMKDKMDTLACSPRSEKALPSKDKEGEEAEDETGSEEGNDVFTEKSLKLQLRNVRRQDLGDSYRWSVQFVKKDATMDLDVEWQIVYQRVIDIQRGNILKNVNNAEKNLEETFFIANKSVNIRQFGVEFNWENHSVLRVELNTFAEEDEVEPDLSMPHFSMSRNREVVYQRGKNTSIQVTIGNEIYLNRRSSEVLVNLTTSQFQPFRSRLLHGNTTVLKSYLDTKEMLIVLDTADSLVSGILRLSFTKDYDRGLVRDIMYGRSLELRPSDQRGPFPTGFIGFYTYFGDGHTQTCVSNDTERCILYCVAFGGDMVNFTIARNNSYGEDSWMMTDVPRTAITRDDRNDNMWVKVFKASPPVNGDWKQSYVCHVANTLGKETKLTTHIKWSEPIRIPTRILANESTARVVNESATELTCVSIGDPSPDVQFQVNFDSSGSSDFDYVSYDYGFGVENSDSSPDNVYVNGSRTVARKLVVTNETSGPLSGAFCLTSQDMSIGGSMDMYTYSIGDFLEPTPDLTWEL